MVFPLIMFPCIFVYSFSSLLISEFSYMNAKKDFSKMNFAINKILKFCFLFSFLVMGFFWCFSEELSFFIYPSDDVSLYIKLLCPLVVLMYVDNVVDSILKGLDKQVLVMGINILDLISTIFLIYFLLPYKGVDGYIFALYISEFLNGVLSLVLLIKTTKFKIDFINFFVKPIFCIVFLNFIFSFFKIGNNFVKFIFYGFSFVFFYLVFIVLLKSIVKKDIKF